jgi:Tfp pilus assembly PilM family ATPase
MSRGVGIELTDQRVRVCAIDLGGRNLKILGFGDQPITVEKDKDPVAAASEAVRKALAEARAGRGRCVASVDSGEAIVRELTLPFKAEEQLRKTVTFELESQLHVAIDDLVVDHFKTGETETGASVLAVAIPKKSVTQKLKVLEGAGIDPLAIDLDMAALFATYEKTGAITSDDPFLIVYGTSRFTKILLVEARKPRSLRTIRFSFPTADDVVREAEERQKAANWQTRDLEGPAPIVILGEKEQKQFKELDVEHRSTLIEILAKEVQRFLLASAAASTPTHILLAGDYENQEAAGMLETALALPVKTHSPLAGATHPFGEDASVAGRIAVPLGLALKACDADPLGLDFRKSEFSYKKKYEAVKTTALVTLELVIVLLAAVCLYFHFEHDRLKAGHDQMIQLESQVFELATGRQPTSPEEAYDELVGLHRKLELQFGGGDHPIERSALDLTSQLFRAIYTFGEKFQQKQLGGQKLFLMVDSVVITQNTTPGSESVDVQLSCTIQNLEYITALKQEFRLTEPFKDAKWDIQEGGGGSDGDRRRIRFTLRKAKKA